MFDYIKGVITGKNNYSKGTYITVETYGMGYLLEVTARDYSEIKTLDSECKIFTVLLHREDKMSLCGFLHREDRGEDRDEDAGLSAFPSGNVLPGFYLHDCAVGPGQDQRQSGGDGGVSGRCNAG